MTTTPTEFVPVETAVLNVLAECPDEVARIVLAGALNEWISRVLTRAIKVDRAVTINTLLENGMSAAELSRKTGLLLSRIAKYREVYETEAEVKA
jgi:hypothetical protein